MQAHERQNRIQTFLQKKEFASLDELAELVDASASTIRRDLATLEARGMIKRTHGGARLPLLRSDEFAFSNRDTHQLAEKEAIGKACAALIDPNQSVIIDAGTTAFHVARHLESKTPQIITHSLPVANLYNAATPVEVLVSGGVIYPRLGVLVGPHAVETFSKVRADVAIMSAGGITREGIMNSHALLVDIQRAMIRAAEKVIFCLDSTKFGRQSVALLCDFDCVNVIVTDPAVPNKFRKQLKKRGVEIVIAGENDVEDVEK